jgi:hypothetical protein
MQRGSRAVPIIVGLIELGVAFFVAGIGSGIVYYITILIAGVLAILGLRSLYMGIFAKQEIIDQETLNKK